MRLRISKNKLNNLSLQQFFRQAGYYPLNDRRASSPSFVRRLSRDYYPRFHVYYSLEDDGYLLNLHLDQKKASYSGQKAHSAEYDGDLVENEIIRLKRMLEVDREREIKSKELESKNKSFLSKFFKF